MRDIPNYIDDPQQILFWEFDEFILLAIAFGVGIMVNYLGVLILSGLAGIKVYRRIKDRQANGFLLHALYWYAGLGCDETPPTSRPLAFIRRFF
ncbi:type IV conjugative transfer system protein TraL [Methylobacter luteus]|jgi:conjugal transfer pilus assembly protein TraL|uniref:type IV conjugative transfer system protein TraL n=1 Tax=Methylobacter luteus TaxID=415 RepID=UPI00040ADAAD|nr:type IV conjugative transfer system protein TraL [Methylobacter luteus]